MRVANATAIPLLVNVTDQKALARRWVTVCAKATFTWEPQPRLVTEQPLPLLANDTPSPWGLLPRDDLPRTDPAFEVILLGQAKAPNGRPVSRMVVSLLVGRVLRQLQVWGNRSWETKGKGRAPKISEPEPFTAMPLVWERAFGGSVEVEIDRESFVDVCDPRNPAGRGFDPGPQAQGLGLALQSPKPFPKWHYPRLLPNLENPAAPILRPGDAPDPACWATLPPSSAIHGLRAVTPTGITPGMFHRAVPQWVIPLPEADARVDSEGLEMCGFALPRLAVVADVLVGETGRSVPLRPDMLVLLPEQGAFTLLFRTGFPMESPNGTARSLRLRTEDGWGNA